VKQALEITPIHAQYTPPTQTRLNSTVELSRVGAGGVNRIRN